MSSAASRRRHRQRRRANVRLAAAQKELAERQVDLVSYERVIVDMTTRHQLPPFGGAQAIALVTMCRNVTRQDCEQLTRTIAALKDDRDRLHAQEITPT